MDLAAAYGILGVERTATLQEAKRAYRTRAQLMHPDRVTAGLRPDAEHAMAQLNEAWAAVQVAIADGVQQVPRSRRPASDEGAAGVREPRLPYLGECDFCGWSPARPIKLRRVTGAIIWWTRRQAEMDLCRHCSDAFYTESQAHCLMKGWWGIIAPLGNLYALVVNYSAISGQRGAISLPQTRDPAVVTPMPMPMPFIPLSRRPAPILFTILAILLATIFIGNAVSGSTGPTGSPTEGPESDARTGLVGTCLTVGGRPIDCDDPLGVYRLTEQVATPDLCLGDAFQNRSNSQWFCAVRM